MKKDEATALDAEEAAWEAHLAAAWKASAGGGAEGPEDSMAFARRLDGALARERAARWKRRAAAWLAWGAAAACAALVGWSALHGGRGAGAGGTEVAAAAAEEETSLEEERMAPVADAFEELEEMLTEMAGLDLSYDWDDEDLEVVD